MEFSEALVRKRKSGVIVVNRGIEQDLWMRQEVPERGVVIELVVEHLNHDVRTGEVGEPIAKNILRQKPSPDPTALKIESQRFSKGRLREGARLLAQPVIRGRECSPGDPRNHIDLLQELAMLELEHHGGAKVGSAASTARDG